MDGLLQLVSIIIGIYSSIFVFSLLNCIGILVYKYVLLFHYGKILIQSLHHLCRLFICIYTCTNTHAQQSLEELICGLIIRLGV